MVTYNGMWALCSSWKVWLGIPVSLAALLMITSSSQPAEAIRKGRRDYKLSALQLFALLFYYFIRTFSQDWPALA